MEAGLVYRVGIAMHRPTILPRQGEVAPEASEGEGTEQTFRLPPLRLASARHLPLAGEDHSASCYAGNSPRTRKKSSTFSSGIPSTVNWLPSILANSCAPGPSIR